MFKNLTRTSKHFIRTIRKEIIKEKNGILVSEPERDHSLIIKDVIYSLRTPKRYNLAEINKIKNSILKLEIPPDLFEKQPLRCHGCGSFFHSDPDLNHGYISDEIFSRISRGIVSLDNVRCKLCYDCKCHKKNLPVFMKNPAYKSYLSFVKNRPCLVIYVIDVCDFYGSVIDDIFEIIGNKKRVIVVFNKIDLIPQDGFHSLALKHIQETADRFLKSHFSLFGLKIVDRVFVSCQNLVGFPDLTKAIVENYLGGQNIVIMGGCNSGKSTIYNLLQTFLSVDHFEGNLSMSTVSPYPGTTANLVRFPISNRIIESLSKLIEDEPKEIDNEAHFTVDSNIFKDLQIKRCIGEEYSLSANDERNKNINRISQFHLSSIPLTTAPKLNDQRWLYDTPSTLSKNQIWNHLTTNEMKYALISGTIHPRTYKIHKDFSVCIGNIARIDVVSVECLGNNENINLEQNTERVIISVFCEHQIPQFCCPTLSAPSHTEVLAYRGKLKIPENSKNSNLPDFTPQYVIIYGEDIKRCASDICIPSIGWVGVAAAKSVKVTLIVWTRGQKVDIRTPSLVPQLIMHKGNPGITEFGRVSTHSYKFMKNIRPMTKMYENVKEVRIMNENLDLIEKKLDSENIERKKIRKDLLKIEEKKKMIGYEKKKLKREEYYLK